MKESIFSSWLTLGAGVILGIIVSFSSNMDPVTTKTSLNIPRASECQGRMVRKPNGVDGTEKGKQDLKGTRNDVKSASVMETDIKLLAKRSFEFMDKQKSNNFAADHVKDGNDRVKMRKRSAKKRNIDTQLSKDGHMHKTDDSAVADSLYKKVRVLCWVMTQPKNLETRARHIKNTWGKRCNKLLFFSSVGNDTFPTIGLGTGETRSDLQAKTSKAFRYVYQYHFNDYDWFMRTDDDAYVIMENLRYFLSGQDTNGTYYFGHHFKVIVKGGYFSGGPGIVVGRKALKLFAERSWDKTKCETFGEADDAEFGRCLYNFGIYAGNSSDILGRNRFYCFDPGTHLIGNYPDWYLEYDANGAKHGIESMSDYAIGFHYVTAAKIYELEWFVYHLRPYGIIFGDHYLNQPIENTHPNTLPHKAFGIR